MAIANLLNDKNVFISFITELEMLGYFGLKSDEHKRINKFLKDCIIIDLNDNIKKIQ